MQINKLESQKIPCLLSDRSWKWAPGAQETELNQGWETDSIMREPGTTSPRTPSHSQVYLQAEGFNKILLKQNQKESIILHLKLSFNFKI